LVREKKPPAEGAHKSKSESMFEERARERGTVVPKSVKESSVSESLTAQKPVLILLAGAAGAGKTTLYESQLRTAFPVLLKASASPIEQAETDRERSRLTKEGHSFVYQDTTIDSQMIREALEAGFDFKVFYVGTEDPNLNMGRVLLRVSNGGPLAALARIPDDYADGIKHLREAKRLADDLMLFDNTTHGRGHRLVAHFHAGELMKLARAVPKWAQKVFGKEFEKWLGSHERSLGRAR
jgi:predicted ABC-type ATPase